MGTSTIKYHFQAAYVINTMHGSTAIIVIDILMRSLNTLSCNVSMIKREKHLKKVLFV